LLRRGHGQRISLYVDDVVIFLQSRTDELALTKELLRIFENATGLVTNISKSSVTPIQCGEEELAEVQEVMACKVENFPYKYLGMPLSVRKLRKNDLIPLVDKVAYHLPEWKEALMHLAGHAALVKAVLTAVPVYHFIALQCPKWMIKAINKIRRGFLWKGRRDIKGGLSGPKEDHGGAAAAAAMGPPRGG
jgi:hypothetical protein